MIASHHAVLTRSHALTDEVVDIPTTWQAVDRYLEQLKVDNVRSLIEQAHMRPADTDVVVFVVRTTFITLEAQNALLKVLEEPPASSRFIFVVPDDLVILPTILSRVVEVRSHGVSDDEMFAAFLSAAPAERLQQIEKATKQKDVTWQRGIKTGLINYLRTTAQVSGKAELEFVTRLLLTRGASNKMLLEHAALVLPAKA